MLLVNNMMIMVLVSAASSLLNQLAVKLILRPERIREKMEALKTFRMERTAATKLKDYKLLKKLDKQQIRMSQVEKEVTSFQTKMMIISIVTMFLPFYLLTLTLPMGNIAGYFPASLYGGDDKVALNLLLWYSICAFFFSQVFRKAFGTGV